MEHILNRIVRSNLLVILVLTSFVFIIYSFMLQPNFKTADDAYSIKTNENIRDVRQIPIIFTSSYFGDKSYYRPFVYITYMVEYHFFGLNALYFYIDNIFLHALSAVLIFFLMTLLLENRTQAFFVSFLFAVHPIYWEPVSNIRDRAILLSGLFYFWSMLCFIKFIKNDKKNKIIYFFSLILFLLSMLSKETGAILPAVILTYLFLIERRDTFKKAWHLLLPFFMMNLAYIFARKTFGIMEIINSDSIKNTMFGFFTFLRSIGTYLRLFILPVDLQFERSRKVFTSMLEPQLIITLLLFLTILILIIRFRKRLPVIAVFALIWTALDLMPVSQLLLYIGTQPNYISTAEHFLYIASLGVFIIGVLFVQWLYNKNAQQRILSKAVVHICLIGFFAFLIIKSIEQNYYSSNEYSMLEHSIKLNPNSYRMNLSLALLYVKINKFDLAEKYFRQALKENPFDVQARICLGKSLIDQNKIEEGIWEYNKVADPGEFKYLLENNIHLANALLIKHKQKLINH